MGMATKGRGRKCLVNNSTSTWIHRISWIITSWKATNSHKFIISHLNVQSHVHTTHLHRILFMTHTFLTLDFFPHQHCRQEWSYGSTWGLTRPFPSLFAPPIQEESENQTELHVTILWTGVLIISDTLNLCQGSAKTWHFSATKVWFIYVTPKWWLPCMVVIQSQVILVVMLLNTCGCSLWLCHLARALLKNPLSTSMSCG